MRPGADDLVTSHLDFVRRLAREIARKLPRNVDYDELVALGMVGLVEAAERYQPGRGASFETFARYRIRGHIFDGLRRIAWLPRRARGWIGAQESVDVLAAHAPAAADIESHGISDRRTVFAALTGNVGAVFLLARAGAGDDDAAPDCERVDERSAAEEAESRELLARLAAALETLADEPRQLLRLCYFEQLSFAEIARRTGVDKSTIFRRHEAALVSLRAEISERRPPAAQSPYVSEPDSVAA